jgi:hypothetical protein
MGSGVNTRSPSTVSFIDAIFNSEYRLEQHRKVGWLAPFWINLIHWEMFSRPDVSDEDQVDALSHRVLTRSANPTTSPSQEPSAPPNKTSKTGDTAKPKSTKEKGVR